MTLVHALVPLVTALVLMGTVAELSSVATEPSALARDALTVPPGETTEPDPPNAPEIDDSEADLSFLSPVLTW